MGSSNNSLFTIPYWLLVHFTFNPPNEELLKILEDKNRGEDSENINIIPEITLCNQEPREIPALVCNWAKSLGKEWFTEGNNRHKKWYFFGRPDRKYSNSKRSNRTTGEGYWKKTGDEREIKAPGSNTVMRRRILTFQERAGPKAKKKEKKTANWVIHEYYLTQAHSIDQIGDFVISCLKKNSDMSDHHDKEDSPICSEAETGKGTVENQAAETGIPNQDEVHDNGFIELDDLASPSVYMESSMCGEAETGTGGSSTVENQAAETGIPSKDECTGSPTDSCAVEKDPSNSVEGQPDSCISPEMIDERYESGTLYSIVYPSQPSQTYQPQIHSPSTSTKLGNDSHTNNVNYGKCHKRKDTFEDNTSYPPKKKNIPTNYHDEVLGNTEPCCENQAANDGISEGYPQSGTNLGLLPIQQQYSDYTPPSINREEWDALDYLLSQFGDNEIFSRKVLRS